MKLAIVFPGQGSQSLGMLSALAKSYPVIQASFAQASEVLGYDLWKLTQEGPADRLDQTSITQPLMLAADIAIYRVLADLLEKHHIKPVIFAGHSLGEYAALVATESLDFAEAIKLVRVRGETMQAAVAEGIGAMGAVVGLDNDVVAQICTDISKQHQVSKELVVPANLNAIGQVVIAGHKPAVMLALEAAKAAGAKLAKIIPVSVPSHSPLMQSAADRFVTYLENVTVKPPITPVIHNANLQCLDNPAEIKTSLVQQLVLPVRWVETLQAMQAQGVTHLIECGPGKVLTGLAKRTISSIPCWPSDTPEALNMIMEACSHE
jgi:[acyl-carrier-protein] S-malonyltransferase